MVSEVGLNGLDQEWESCGGPGVLPLKRTLRGQCGGDAGSWKDDLLNCGLAWESLREQHKGSVGSCGSPGFGDLQHHRFLVPPCLLEELGMAPGKKLDLRVPKLGVYSGRDG